MKHLLRNFFLPFALVQASIALAQPTPPYQVEIRGNIPGCVQLGEQDHVTITTLPGTMPALNFQAFVQGTVNCRFGAVLNMTSYSGGFNITYPCNGALVSTTVQYEASAIPPQQNIVYAVLGCSTQYQDCEGTVGGNALPTTPCDDGDPNTTNELWNSGCQCVSTAETTGPITISGVVSSCAGAGHPVHLFSFGSPELVTTVLTDPNCAYSHTFYRTQPSGSFEVFTSCDGGVNYTTQLATWGPNNMNPTANFTCGNTTDCLGVPGGTALPGTPCNTPAGNLGVYDAQCICVETSTAVSACIGMEQTAPFIAVFSSCTTGGTPAYDNLWDFSDGGAVPGDNIAHTYAGPGTYTVCLNVTDGDGMFDATCEQIYVDANGGISFDPPVGCEACFSVIPVMNGNNPVPFQANFINCSTGAPTLSYLWTLPNGLNSTQQDQQGFTFTAPGVFDVCLEITDGMGCVSIYCDTIIVDPNGGINTTPAWYDCMGVLWGSAVVGSTCDDGDPDTFNDVYAPNCTCIGFPAGECFTWVDWYQALDAGAPVPFQVEYSAITAGVQPITYSWYFGDVSNGLPYVLEGTSTAPTWSRMFSGGEALAFMVVAVDANGCESIYTNAEAIMSCDGILGSLALPNFPCTTVLGVQGAWNNNCECVPNSVVYDCLQIPNGPNLPGTPCQQAGLIGTWDADCNCVPNSPGDCEAGFWVLQAYENGDTTGTPIPNTLWVWNLSNGGSGLYQFLWDFGDGSTSTAAFPTHVYPDSGPYVLCLTLFDSEGCTDTYCDSVYVDDDGMYNGLVGEAGNRSAFTIHVIDPLTVGLVEDPGLTGLNTWPNPTQEVLNVSLTGRSSGAVHYIISDLGGRQVGTGTKTLSGTVDRFTVPVSELEEGLYLITIRNGSSTVGQRFVKMR